VILPFGLTAGQAGFLAVAFFVAALVRGYSGFGLTALSVSAAGLVIDPLKVVPVVIVADIALTVLQAGGIRAHIDWRRVGTLLAGALVGVPVGVWALSGIGIDAARAMISGFILLMCALLWWGWTFRHRVGDAGHIAIGVLSGLSNAAAVGGLPVAAFFAAQGIPAAAFRATLIVYFSLLDLWTVPVMAWNGLITRETLVAAGLSLPVFAVGVWLGGKHFLRAEPQSFRRFAILLLAGLAAVGLIRSVMQA
jgi:uncharacterized protein